MFRQGFVEEVRRLTMLHQPLSRTARQAVGYKEVIEHIGGQRSLDDTIELVQRRSRQFAKRQLTWLRNMPECRHIPLEAMHDPTEIARRLIAEISSP
jgi:tRNA dimethylallyltransferase